MANEEHVRRLRDEGVEAWNAWRETKPGVRPDLASTNLNDDYHAAFQRLLRNLKAEGSRLSDINREILGVKQIREPSRQYHVSSAIPHNELIRLCLLRRPDEALWPSF